MLHANNCFIVLLDFDNFINSLFCNYFNYFDLVMRASSLLAFRCYFELPSINKDLTSIKTSLKSNTPVENELKLLVFYAMLLSLFSMFCFNCKMEKPKVEIEKQMVPC